MPIATAPSPTAPPPTAPSPTAPSPTAPSPTAPSPTRPGRTAPGRTAWGLVTVLGLGALTGCSGSPPPVEVSSSACATAWSPAADGRVDTAVRNTGGYVLRVELVDATTADVFAAVPALAPGTSWQLRTRLPNGSYRLDCTPAEGSGTSRSPVRRVTASTAARGNPLRPVTQAELAGARRSLVMGLTLTLTALTQDVTDLQAAVRRGDLAGARMRWLQAHARYESLTGPVPLFAGSAALDLLPDGLPGGADDPGFTGFHRVEYLLWHGGGRPALEAATAGLVREVSVLATAMRTGSGSGAALVGAPRTLLERTVRVTLTGADDLGSHSGLATAAADLTAASRLVTVLQPLLRTRDPGLASRAADGLAGLAARLDLLRHPDGSYPAPDALDAAQRRDLLAAAAEQLEVVALIPATLQPTAAADPD